MRWHSSIRLYHCISQAILCFVSEKHKVLVVRRFPRIAFQNPRALVRWSESRPTIGLSGRGWWPFRGRETKLRAPSAALRLTKRLEEGRSGHSLSNTDLQGVGHLQAGNGSRLLVHGSLPVNAPGWKPGLSGQTLCKVFQRFRELCCLINNQLNSAIDLS